MTREDAFAETVAADGVTAVPSGTLRVTTRSAVLPRAGEEAREPGERYAKKRVLGQGGMGEVVLAEDRDIGRDVAMKYLTAHQDPAAIARFVDEIRIVGSLEHPNIVPIHDVGRDESDRYYFVMKHVEGETLEHVIERLAAGDPKYVARYTFTVRAEIFVALLRALEFAHAHGYVHRDIKPANVMVGPYGEVVLMDWGVAKRRTSAEDSGAATVDDESRPIRERLFTTRRGAIVGTPAYMSPEQARGDVEAIDERSDVYCASVLFHELMTLRHYLGDRESLPAMLRAIQNEAVDVFSIPSHPVQGPAPAEYVHVVNRGIQKKAADRFQSVGEMIEQIEAALDGRLKVQCPVTFTKRITRELGRFIDRHPAAGFRLFGLMSLLFVAWIVWSIYAALHMHA
ncbi:MAG TPA: serine/threonine-protein kinase [Polyangiaceae bacterium]